RAEVLAFPVDHRRAHTWREVLEGVADGQDQPVIQRIALEWSGQPHERDLLLVTDKAHGQIGVGIIHGTGKIWLVELTDCGYKQ
ncbi:hypothetical protein RZS08_37110, partial [Arthrospira platensis SPKY1]|nr:hypothetical protein [Arthrospira platensis SPKY1]